jgi:hypothetical protein
VKIEPQAPEAEQQSRLNDSAPEEAV